MSTQRLTIIYTLSASQLSLKVSTPAIIMAEFLTTQDDKKVYADLTELRIPPTALKYLINPANVIKDIEAQAQQTAEQYWQTKESNQLITHTN